MVDDLFVEEPDCLCGSLRSLLREKLLGIVLNVIGNIIELGVKTNNCRIVYFIDLSYQRISKVSQK